MTAEKRVAIRKNIDSIHICDLTSMNSYLVIAKIGYIVDASITGFLLEVNRNDLLPKELKANLNIDTLRGEAVVLYLPQMNLDLDGTVIRTRHIGKGNYHIAIEFSAEVPQYWRECLIDLLPEPGELELD